VDTFMSSAAKAFIDGYRKVGTNTNPTFDSTSVLGLGEEQRLNFQRAVYCHNCGGRDCHYFVVCSLPLCTDTEEISVRSHQRLQNPLRGSYETHIPVKPYNDRETGVIVYEQSSLVSTVQIWDEGAIRVLVCHESVKLSCTIDK